MQLRGLLLGAVVLGSCLLAAAGVAGGAAAASMSDKVGRPGGTSFEAECATGQAVVGWAYNYADVLMALAPMCQDFAGGALTGAPSASPDSVNGAAGGTASDAYACKPAYGPVVALSVSTTEDLRIHSFKTSCHPQSGAGGGSISGATKTSGAVAATGKLSTKCPAGAYAIGVYGSYTDGGPHAGIQSIGLVCDDGSAAANTGSKRSVEGANGQAADAGGQDGGSGGGITINGLPFQIEINIGPGEGGLNFGPAGKTRTLRTDSTVYSDKGNTEIAYLEKGDKVTVLGCEDGGDGWCQISKPMRGLVWGGDLK